MSKEDEQVIKPEDNKDEPTEEEQAAALDKVVSEAIDEVTPEPPEKKDDDDKVDDDKVDDDKVDDDKVDPVNDPIPESTNEKTAGRIKSLIGIIKEKETAEVQRDEILDEINATGAQPEQYAATLGFLKLYNSTNDTERKQALVVARGLVKELALDLGEGASVVNLSEHDDLAAEVEAGTLTEARALEMAAGRDAKVLQDARNKQASEKQDETALTNQNIVTGREQLDSFEGAMRSADANYAKIRSAFIKLLRPVLKRTHPTEWGAAALELYNEVKTLPIQEQPKPKPKPKQQPLRPKGDAGGGDEPAPEAGSAVDAVDQALANM